MPVIQTSNKYTFVLEIGQESVGVPQGFANPDEVWLRGARNRKHRLTRMTWEAYQTAGQRYRLGRDDTATHLLGLPIYYAVHERELYVWPLPAHRWEGGVEKRMAETVSDEF